MKPDMKEDMKPEMITAGWHTVKVDGIKIEYQTCDHCGKNPTDDELVDLAQQTRKNISLFPCAHCNGSFSVTEIQALHYKSGTREAWSSVASLLEPRLEVRFEGALETQKLHLGCAQKLFPNMSEGSLKLYLR